MAIIRKMYVFVHGSIFFCPLADDPTTGQSSVTTTVESEARAVRYGRAKMISNISTNIICNPPVILHTPFIIMIVWKDFFLPKNQHIDN